MSRSIQKGPFVKLCSARFSTKWKKILNHMFRRATKDSIKKEKYCRAPLHLIEIHDVWSGTKVWCIDKKFLRK